MEPPSTRNQGTELHLAVLNRQAKQARYLLEQGCDVDVRNKADITPLMIAARFGYQEIAEVLLQYGANPNAVDQFKRGPLHRAISARQVDIVRLLLRSGADPNLSCPILNSPVLFVFPLLSVLRDHDEKSITAMVKLLLEAGANPNKSDKHGITPLMESVLNGYRDAASLLMEAGAQPEYLRQMIQNIDLTDSSLRSEYDEDVLRLKNTLKHLRDKHSRLLS